MLSCEAIWSLVKRDDKRNRWYSCKADPEALFRFEKEASETITSTTFQTCTSPLSDVKDKKT